MAGLALLFVVLVWAGMRKPKGEDLRAAQVILRRFGLRRRTKEEAEHFRKWPGEAPEVRFRGLTSSSRRQTDE